MLNVSYYEMSGEKIGESKRQREGSGKLDISENRSLTVNVSFFMTEMN